MMLKQLRKNQLLWVVPMFLVGTTHSFADDELDSWQGWEKNEESQFAQYENRVLDDWSLHEKAISQKWGDSIELPSRKISVQYSHSDLNRIKVDYESGEVLIEVLSSPMSSKKQVSNEMEQTLGQAIEKRNLASGLINQEEVDSKYKDARAVIENNSISLKGLLTGGDGVERTQYQLRFQLKKGYLNTRAQKIYPIVKKWSDQYHLDPALVMAIIRQESSFNPKARSSIPCYGLMQIYPIYAGKEAIKAVTGKTLVPESEFLYDPEKNIMLGTTYLQLLRDQYFHQYPNDENKLYLMIASYNWGPNRVQKLLKKGKLKYDSPSRQLFEQIQSHAPRETADYLVKVIKYREVYRGVSFLASIQ